LFQGGRELRERNWAAFPVPPSSIDAVLLSHAHIDHSGYLPLLVRQGFRGMVYCTPGTAELLPVMLADSARLQEEDAEETNRQGRSRHQPALPLYTIDDVQALIPLIAAGPYGVPAPIGPGVQAIFRRTGHILGAASIELQLGADDRLRCVYSGDLGRWGRPILRDPEFVPEADVLLVESTYGDRTHPPESDAQLAAIVNEAAARGGALIIPAFVVGRIQDLVWTLRRLEDEGRIPILPVYVDSPMAIEVTEHYILHPEEHHLAMNLLRDPERCPLRCRRQEWIRTRRESEALHELDEPMIIISASGMATGGRVLDHLARRLPDPRTTVLLAGYQAAETRGRQLLDGAKSIRIRGQEVQVNAQVRSLIGMSAHADREEILRWLGGFRGPPRHCYLIHGEPAACAALAATIKARLGWVAAIPQLGDAVSLMDP
jgi:metallo-beta-lactamase family protein